MEEQKRVRRVEKRPSMELDENGEWDWGDSEDYIIDCMLDDSVLVTSLRGREDIYGNDEEYMETCSALEAAEYSRDLGGDELVARAIHIGVAIADPAFDEVGEEFLRKVLPGYNKADYGEAMIRGVLNRIKTSRKDIIVKGVRDLIEGRENNSVEVQAVLLAKKVRDLFSITYAGNEEVGRDLDMAIDNNILYLIGEGVTDIEELYEKAREMSAPYIEHLLTENTLRPVGVKKANPNNMKYLMYAYEYFTENYDRIPRIDFKDLFPKHQHDKNMMVAYYVASRPEKGLKSFYQEMRKLEKKNEK